MPSTKSESLRKKQAVIREAKRKAIYEASLSPVQRKIITSKLTRWDQFVWGMPTFLTAVLITLAAVMYSGLAGGNIAMNSIILIGLASVTSLSALWVWNKFTADRIAFAERVTLHLLPFALGAITVLVPVAVLNHENGDVPTNLSLIATPLMFAAGYGLLMRAPKRYGVKRATA
jgi:hypothetical protein